MVHDARYSHNANWQSSQKLAYSATMSTWKKIRYRLEWLGLLWLYWSIPLLPRRFAHWLGQGMGNLAYAADRRGREMALENLTIIFGAEKSAEQIKRIARSSYRTFAQTVVDQFWSSRLNRENYLHYCTVEFADPEAMERARETGAIWVTPHYGNFEWVALIAGFMDYRFTIVAQDFKNESLTEIYRKNRETSGHEVIPQKGALIRLMRTLRSGGHAAFLTDLTIAPSKAATIIECFGRKTCVTAIHAELMKRTGLPVIPGICIPQKNGSYLIRGFRALEFGPNDTLQTIAQACWEVFEPIIRENPAPWLWMYKHWRFLPEETPVTYPRYARRYVPFDQLEATLAGSGAAQRHEMND
jgi:Kdo2-lipid IVA lauroyltransferase/acyltransferase